MVLLWELKIAHKTEGQLRQTEQHDKTLLDIGHLSDGPRLGRAEMLTLNRFQEKRQALLVDLMKALE
jgi:hypothetical protein